MASQSSTTTRTRMCIRTYTLMSTGTQMASCIPTPMSTPIRTNTHITTFTSQARSRYMHDHSIEELHGHGGPEHETELHEHSHCIEELMDTPLPPTKSNCTSIRTKRDA